MMLTLLAGGYVAATVSGAAGFRGALLLLPIAAGAVGPKQAQCHGVSLAFEFLAGTPPPLHEPDGGRSPDPLATRHTPKFGRQADWAALPDLARTPRTNHVATTSWFIIRANRSLPFDNS